MLQLSEKMPIFVPWFRKSPRHRGELLSFDPSENLENSRVRARSLKAASPAVAYILLSPVWSRLTYIPAGVSRFHSYLYGYSRTFRLRMSRRLTLFVHN